MSDPRIFCGNSNIRLAEDVVSQLGLRLGEAKVTQFSDGEAHVAIEENVRGEDCFVIQSTCAPTNTNLMELLIMIDALRRSSARRITAVIPYYGYARQDRQNKARMPITAKLVADLITTAGADRVMCIDLHAGQIQGFFNVPVDNLHGRPVLLAAVKEMFQGYDPKTLLIVSPDAGGVERARAYAKRLGCGIAIVDKRREQANESEVMHIVGDVRGHQCIIVDDMVDTASTLCKGAAALMVEGAEGVVAAITHPVLSGPAIENLANSKDLLELLTTDTIPIRGVRDYGARVNVISVAPLLAEAIRRTNNEESISSLFV